MRVLSDGTFALDGGAMFGIVPRPLWQQAMEPDAANRVRLGLNCLLVRTGSHVLLVDTGVGDTADATFLSRYGVDRGGGLIGDLRAAGLAPEQVTGVVNTHLHWDHCGGNTRRDEAGRLIATFPNAVYYAQRGELLTARSQEERTHGSYRRDGYEPLLDAGRMILVDGEVELAPGVRVHPAAGHLPHMQVVTVTGTRQTLLFISDLVPTRHHLSPAWVMAYDLEPLVTVTVKKRWLARAAAEGWIIAFPHDASCPTTRIEERDGRWRVRDGEGC